MVHSAKRLDAVMACAAVAFVLGQSAPASATSIDPALSIVGNIEFVDGLATFQPGTTHTTTMTAVSGGTTTATVIDGETVTGNNPLDVPLTMINDGLGITSAVRSVFAVLEDSPQYAFPFDINVEVTNTSATDTFRLVFRAVISQFVNADGGDSLAEANFSLHDVTIPDRPAELFFSGITSDTSLGDVVDRVSQESFGEPLSADKQTLLSFVLPPGGNLVLLGLFDARGGVFDDPGTTRLDSTTFLSIHEVTNLATPPAVPLPGAALLFVSACVGLVAWTRRRAG